MRRSIFQLDDVSAGRGTALRLSDFCLEICEGEIVGVVGANGSGKTALCHILQGRIKWNSGTLYYRDQALAGSQIPETAAQRVMLIENHAALAPGLTVAEQLALFNPARAGKLFVNQRWIRTEAERVLLRLNVPIRPDTRVAQLTLAQRHLIMIAGACLQRAELIILNNTVKAYTLQEWKTIKQTLRAVLGGQTAVLLTSVWEERLTQVCDHIAFLSRGTNLKVFEPKDYELLSRILNQQHGGAGEDPLPTMDSSGSGAVFRVSNIHTRLLRGGGF